MNKETSKLKIFNNQTLKISEGHFETLVNILMNP